MLRGTSGISASNKPHSTAGEKTRDPKPKLQGMPAFNGMEGKCEVDRDGKKGRLVVWHQKIQKNRVSGRNSGQVSDAAERSSQIKIVQDLKAEGKCMVKQSFSYSSSNKAILCFESKNYDYFSLRCCHFHFTKSIKGIRANVI